MRNLRLITTFLLASIAMPGISFALGLGAIDVNSFLNQPLKAEIEVISARPGEIDDLLVSLASRDSFARAGLSRPSHLSNLRFAVKKNEAGDQATILVTTKNAIKEPFLNFLVEADWAKGRVLREFTILLDPPFFADSATPAPTTTNASQQVIATPAIEPAVGAADNTLASTSDTTDNSFQPIANTTASPAPSTTPSEVATTEPTAPAVTSSVSSSAAPNSIVVGKGDALWSIASQFKDSAHSMGQVMLAMQRANPGAFTDNNINNLKVGAVLRAPTASEMDELSKQEAYAQVLEQNGLWDDYVARVTGTSVSMANSDGGSDGGDGAQNTNGDLSLLTPGEGDSESAGEGDTSDLKRQLALAEEQLDASRIENQDMQSRIADLEARLSKFDELQKMVQIEDDSLAQLQADQTASLLEEEAALADITSTAEVTVEDPVTVEAPVTVEDGTESSPETDTLVEEMQAADEEVLLNDILSEGTEASNSEEIKDEMIEEEVAVAPPAPVIVTEGTQQKAPSIFDGILPPGVIDMIPSMGGLLGDPILLGGLGGIVILVLGFVLYRRRKGNDDDDDDDDDIIASDTELEDSAAIDDDLTPIHLAESAADAASNTSIDTNLAELEPIDDEDDDFSKTAVLSAVSTNEPAPEEQESAPAEQDDVLNEVDVYLAYGLYDNAEELLKQNLESNPARADYRSKLLDTYFATKSVAEFSSEAELLKSMGSAGDKYWDKAQVMGYELDPGNPLFSAGKDINISAAELAVAKPAAADFDLGAGDDETNFSNTDFNLSEGNDAFAETQAVDSIQADNANTQESPDFDLGDAPQLEDDLPDDLGELEFSLGDEDEDISEVNFDVSDDLDLDDEGNDLDDISVDFDMGDAEDISSNTDFDLGDAGDALEATAVIGSSLDDSLEADDNLDIDDSISASESEPDFDLGMEDTALMESANTGDDIELDLDLDGPVEEADLESLDDLDSGDDMDLLLDGADDSSDDVADTDDESLAFDMDLSGDDDSQTGTFAPGDFDNPDEISIPDEVDIDDIGDLMLPDDVDEVSTKLDLARAFIDMGDAEGARGSLEEVLTEGNDDQKAEATGLLEKI